MNDEVAAWPERPRKVPNIFTTALAVPSIIATLALGLLGPPIIGLFVLLLLVQPSVLVFVLIPAAILAAIVYPIALFVIKRRKRLLLEIQAERDAFAVGVADLLEAGQEAPPFSLYLRPFFTDGHLTADEGAARLIAIDPTELAEIGQTRDTERAMAIALEEHAPLISLGRPSDRIGAGRIETDDENWKALFKKLIANAERVIMVPIGQPATMEEVRTIASTPELLEKTVFVRPSNRRKKAFNFTPDESVTSIKGMWEWTREQLADVLPNFPAFGHSPRLITFDEEGNVSEYRGNGMTSTQLPSGVRDFMTQGRTAIANKWLVAALLFVAFLVTIPLMGVPVNYYISLFSGTIPALDPLDGQRAVSLFNLLGTWSLALVAYKFVTGDIPTRFVWPGIFMVMIFLTTSTAYTYFLDATMEFYDPYAPERPVTDAELRLAEYAVVTAEVALVWKVALFGWLSTSLITGNALQLRHILIPIGTYVVLSLLARGLSDSGSIGALVWAATIIPVLIAPILPIFRHASAVQVVLCLLALLVCYAIAGGIMVASSETLFAAMTMTGTPSPGLLTVAFTLLPAAIPVIAFGFIARMITGQGREQAWSYALPRYEG